MYDEESFWTDVEWLEGLGLETKEAVDFLNYIIKRSGGKITKNKEFMDKFLANKI